MDAVLDFQDGGNENIREAGNRCLIRSLLLGVQGKAKANPKALQFRMGTRQEIPGATTQLGIHMLEGSLDLHLADPPNPLSELTF